MTGKGTLSAVYVYGLVRASLLMDPGPIGIEEAGAPAVVYTLKTGSLGAVVSARKNRNAVMPRRRDLEAHRRVTTMFAAAGTILPFAFGQVARSEQAVLSFLRAQEAAVCRELDRLDGKVQMGLKVHWDVDNIYQYIIDGDPNLVALRDRMLSSPDCGMEERIELGEAFHEAVETKRNAFVASVRDELSGVSAAPPKEVHVREEKAVADLMFLVERTHRAEFEEQVQRLAARWPDEYVFRATGPWAPFNFVELQFSAGEGDRTWAY